MKILNFGSLNIDYVYKVDHFVKAGETISSEDMQIFCGGKGLNQSISLAKAGCQVYHGGKIGRDGALLRDELVKSKVNTQYLLEGSGPSGHAIIQVEQGGQNSIILFGGENEKVSIEDIDEILKNFSKGDIILLQCEISNVDYIVEAAYEKGITIVLNPSPINKHLAKIDISKVSYLILNELEGAELTGRNQFDSIVKELLNKYKDLKIVLTLGENGVIYADKEKKVKQSIYTTKVVDTTAAGDTFTGYFIAGLIKGLAIEETLRLAAKASSIAVSRKGAAISIPYYEEVLK